MYYLYQNVESEHGQYMRDLWLNLSKNENRQKRSIFFFFFLPGVHFSVFSTKGNQEKDLKKIRKDMRNKNVESVITNHDNLHRERH